MRPIVKLAALVLSASLWWAAGASGATLDPVGEFDQPIFVTSNPADPNELLVVEREGRVMRVSQGVVSELADLTSLVSCCSSERGLLSIAPAPDFGVSGRFYAAYTGNAVAGGVEGDIHVDAFRRSGGAPLREPILTIGHADNPNHNGGQLEFGPDGHLYISTGDGGGGGDPLESGQSLDTLLGKILRIDPRPGQTPPYAIPAGNPFAGGGGLAEVWSYGLRNPWRLSFDRASGDMVVADVGQGAREEVDLAPSPTLGVVGGGGANYGWNCREGFIAYSGAPASCDGAGGFADPVFDYPHADPGGGAAHGCSITGGYVARDASLPGLYGRYVYADFCIGEIRSLVLPSAAGERATGDRSEGLSVSNPTSFGEDSCGRLYVVANGGDVYRLAGAAAPSCPASAPVSAGPQSPRAATGLGRVRVRLRATIRRAGHRPRLVLTVRASPCATLGTAGSSSIAAAGRWPRSGSTAAAQGASVPGSLAERPSGHCSCGPTTRLRRGRIASSWPSGRLADQAAAWEPRAAWMAAVSQRPIASITRPSRSTKRPIPSQASRSPFTVASIAYSTKTTSPRAAQFFISSEMSGIRVLIPRT